MFCHKCGANIDDGSMFCPYCGTQTGTPAAAPKPQQQQYYQNTQQYNQPAAQSDNTIAIVGFILSFFVAIAGLICSIVGYKASKQGAPYGNLALAGIIISSVSMGIAFFGLIFFRDVFWFI